MENVSEYRAKKIGAALLNGTAWIDGLTCDGDSWPDGRHYYIVCVGERVHHVPVHRRPSWMRYINPSLRGGN